LYNIIVGVLLYLFYHYQLVNVHLLTYIGMCYVLFSMYSK